MSAKVLTSVFAHIARAASAAVKSNKSIGPIRLTIACAVLLSILVVTGTGLYIFDLHNRVLASNERGLSSTALIVAKQIEHIFTTVETVQKEFVEQIAEFGNLGKEDFERRLSRYDIHVKLHDKAAGMPYVGSLTLIDAHGRLTNFSRQWPIPNIDVSDRDFFKAFQSDPNLISFIGEPVHDRTNGSWVVHLARKISGPNGEFLGLTSAAVELQYLQNTFSHIIIEPGNGIALIRNDGTLFARIPRIESEIGRRFPTAVSLKLVSTADHAVGRSTGIFDGHIRIVAAHRVGSYPLVVATTKTIAMAFADWRRTAKYTIFAAALIIIAIAAFAILFIKLFRNYQALVNARAERENAQKLRDKSLQFDAALNNMSQGLIMFDASERIILCNRRYVDMYGLSPETVTPGRTLRELLHVRQAMGGFVRDIEEYRLELLNSLALGKAVSIVIVNAAGRSYRVLNVPMADGGWVATHEDVTEKAQAELAILESEKRFSDLFEFSPDGILLCDQRGIIRNVNSEATRMFGYDSCELIGQPIEILIPKDAREGHVGLRSRYSQAPVRRSMGAAQVGIKGLRKDGSAFPANISISPINSAGEKMVCATVRDITEAKQREVSFRLLFENNPVPMWVYDLESLRFLAVNDTAVAHYGYRREQFLAMTVQDIRPPEEHERFAQFVRIAKGTHDGELIWRHQKWDKTKIDVAVYSRALSYEGHAGCLVAAIDVTERKLAEDELNRTKKFLDAIIEHVPQPIVVKDVPHSAKDARDCRLTLVNRAFEEIMGVSRDQIIGRTTHDLYPKDGADHIVERDTETLQSSQAIIVYEHSLVTPNNGTRLVCAKKVAIRDKDEKPQYLLTVLDDVTERRRTEQRIAYLAHTDSLTDLPNRATFVEYLAATLEEASKSGEPFAILCADLDRFKEANDVYGHLVGDGLLREAARRLQAAAAGVFLARVGGDEFTLIVTSGSQPKTAEALGKRLLAAFQDDFEVDGHRLQLGLSIGGAIYPADGTDAKTLIANADAALYQAKANARGSVMFFEAGLGTRLHERRDLQKDLQFAVTRGDFFLHYQPQVKMESNKTTGFEALVRWQCPKRGLVAPDRFIPIAEESSLIIPLGEWILREACREAASWPQPLTIAVNISPVQFHHGDLPRLVHSILLETGLAPARLELEITEGVLIDDFSRAVSILRKLKSLGVQIAMDDFGSGYSSLSYLHSFPFDKIKIDRSFIGDLEHNHHSMAIVRAIVTLGHSLDVPVLAEGVETEAQHLFLAQEGCDEVQGYLTGRPQLIADYAKLVGRQTTTQNNYAAVAG